MFLRSVSALVLLAFVPLAAQNRSASANLGKPVLRTVIEVAMPGPPVRFDYQSLDPTTGRLYIAHMNADQLVLFDTMSRKVIANLDGFARVHGVWAVPELGRVYASVTGRHRVDVVDAKTHAMRDTYLGSKTCGVSGIAGAALTPVAPRLIG